MATLTSNRLAEFAENLFMEMINRNSLYRYDSLKYIVSYGIELYKPIGILEQKEMIWNMGRWLYAALYRISLKKGIEANALKYLTAYSAAKDTMHILDLHRESMELQTRYESERKDQQIMSLAKENEWRESRLRLNRIFLFSLAGFIILIIMMGIILIRQNRIREQQNIIILKQKLFRSQMNPHFIFNSLSSIHHFMLNEDSQKAASYLSRFSKLIRAILHSSGEEYTKLSNEISTIENYLELQKLRFPDKFDFEIHVNEDIDADTIIIPAMIIQPFVENAIEHGVRNKASKGNVTVSFNLNDDILQINVEDNGIGREKAMELLTAQGKAHKSMSTNIICDRIRVLNKTLKKKISLEIIDLKDVQGDPRGTRVLMQL